MFDKTKFKKQLMEYMDSHPEIKPQKLKKVTNINLVSQDDYIQHKPLIDEIVSWYLTMQKEREKAQQWYHTIDLGNGRITNGIYDHRPVLKHYGFPNNLEGKRVLDVGPADGFFSFQFEKMGAKEVVAIDAYENPHFIEAKDVLRSKVDYRIIDVYDLNPKDLGYFDMIFCGTVLTHLSDPFRALSNIRNVMSKDGVFFLAAVVFKPKWYLYPFELILNQSIAELVPGRQSLGRVSSYWVPSPACLREMLYKTGFNNIKKIGSFILHGNYKLTEQKSLYPHIVFKAF